MIFFLVFIPDSSTIPGTNTVSPYDDIIALLCMLVLRITPQSFLAVTTRKSKLNFHYEVIMILVCPGQLPILKFPSPLPLITVMVGYQPKRIEVAAPIKIPQKPTNQNRQRSPQQRKRKRKNPMWSTGRLNMKSLIFLTIQMMSYQENAHLDYQQSMHQKR